jgi:hypothetical protein
MHDISILIRITFYYFVHVNIFVVDKDKDNSTSSVQIGYQILKICKQLFSIFDKLFVLKIAKG